MKNPPRLLKKSVFTFSATNNIWFLSRITTFLVFNVMMLCGAYGQRKTTPVITWGPLTSITYGTPLSNTQLNASTTVPGTFSYNPGAGIILNAGTQKPYYNFYSCKQGII
jgi:hypothetical protein